MGIAISPRHECAHHSSASPCNCVRNRFIAAAWLLITVIAFGFKEHLVPNLEKFDSEVRRLTNRHPDARPYAPAARIPIAEVS
jgi:hypothetical protein